jgi:putative phosphoesterase
MRFAVISDTHDNVPAIRELVENLKGEKVEFVVHAGDVISPFAMKELAKLSVKVYLAFGNNDGDRAKLMEIAMKNGWVAGDIVTFPCEGGGVVYHGTDARICEVLRNANYAFIVFGHTHEPKKEVESDRIVLNPGEVCGYLTGKRTFALVEDGEVSIVEF